MFVDSCAAKNTSHTNLPTVKKIVTPKKNGYDIGTL